MAPHERVMILSPYLLVLLLFVTICSGREVQSHTRFATEHRSLDLTSGKRSANTDINHVRESSSNEDLELENFQQLEKRADHKKVVNPSGNHLYVSKTGNANFNRIQTAIDSIPEYNEQWVQIDIAAGVYQ